ncbi:hypothetical protein K438DRAFT_1799984 [Mycena galopus ATCC 62051]|nr:hypothetical protein K438DRAFT_1799984 [Mycena galopus ATCC 62051]
MNTLYQNSLPPSSMFSERSVLCCIFPTELVSKCLMFKTWEWKIKIFGPDQLATIFWDDYGGGGVLSCYSSQDKDPKNLLAKFTPRTALRRQGQPSEPPRLFVTPPGHVYFDDILMSALVIERTRTAPS